MAQYPGATQLLIEEGDKDGVGDQPRIRPRGIILHTNGSSTSCSGAHSLMLRSDQEFHFQQELGGHLCQYVHTDVRADNNYKGNSFTIGTDLWGYISIETADRGSSSGYELSWTDLGQRKELEDLLVWLCLTHNIPPVRPGSPTGLGIGYHAMWGYNTPCSSGSGTYGVYTAPDGRRGCLNNPWTNAFGKICPGPGKIREYPDLLATVARRVKEGDDMPLTEDEMRKIARYVTEEQISGPGGLGPASMEATLFELRTYIRSIESHVDGVEQGLSEVKTGLSTLETHVQEIEDKVDKIPTIPGGGTGGTLEVKLTGTAAPTPTTP